MQKVAMGTIPQAISACHPRHGDGGIVCRRNRRFRAPDDLVHRAWKQISTKALAPQVLIWLV